jgi:hypothetical protein
MRLLPKPRASLAEHSPPTQRDPVAILTEQAATRQQDLLPIRYGRMAASPFAFLRGAAAVMAAHLAASSVSGLRVQAICDAHLSNFGVFASPERWLIHETGDGVVAGRAHYLAEAKAPVSQSNTPGKESQSSKNSCPRPPVLRRIPSLSWLQRFAPWWYERAGASSSGSKQSGSRQTLREQSAAVSRRAGEQRGKTPSGTLPRLAGSSKISDATQSVFRERDQQRRSALRTRVFASPDGHFVALPSFSPQSRAPTRSATVR